MHKEKVRFRSGDYDLVGLVDIPNKTPAPGVVLYHGLTNAKEDCPLINETAEMLVDEGYVTLRFDFFGSGESPGEMSDKTISLLTRNANDAIEYFLKLPYTQKKIGLWGRSIGGTVIALCGLNPHVKARVFLSPGILLVDGFGHFGEIKERKMELERAGKTLPGTGKYKGPFILNRKFYSELPMIEKGILRNLEKMNNVLVIATTPDIKVKLENSTIIINKAKDPKEIHIFEGVDHSYKGAEEKVLELVKKWFAKFLKV